MKLFHATPRRNIPSIKRRGLLTSKSKGKLPAVWLHSASKRAWATLHTMKRHGAKKVAIISVDVSRHSIRRAGRGLWYTLSDVPADRLTVENSSNDDESEADRSLALCG